MTLFDWIVDSLSVAAVTTSLYFTWRSSRLYRQAREFRERARQELNGE